MNSIESFIKAHSVNSPDKDAIVAGNAKVCYRQLWSMIEERYESLRSSMRRINTVRTTQSADFLVEYFASHLAGVIFVPLASDIPAEDFNSINLELSKLDMPDEASEILYTTGTTGKVKGTIIGKEGILANAENLIDAHRYTADNAFIVTGPLNHIGSLSKVWPTMIAGGTLVITEGMKDFEAFFSALSYPSTRLATFLVPASIRMLLQFARKRLAAYADRIDFIETGAAAISQSDMEALCEVLPDTRLYNTYASTETGIICTHDFNAGHCVAGCLGLPMKNSSVYISEDGAISTSGKTTMLGYAGDAGLTRSVIRDGRCHTQDYGYFDEEGRLNLKGRNGDVINVGGYKVNPLDVENAAMSHPDVRDCICVAAAHPVLGTALRLLVATKGDAVLDKRAIALFLRERLEGYMVPQMYAQVDKIARTYNGKLDRKSYTDHK